MEAPELLGLEVKDPVDGLEIDLPRHANGDDVAILVDVDVLRGQNQVYERLQLLWEVFIAFDDDV